MKAHYEVDTTCYRDLLRAGARDRRTAGKRGSHGQRAAARRLFAGRDYTRHVPLSPGIVDAIESLREHAEAVEHMLSSLAAPDNADPLQVAYEWPVDDGKSAKLALVCRNPSDNAQREVHLCWQNAEGKFGTAPIILCFNATGGIAEAEMRFLQLENQVPRTENATRAFVSNMVTALVARAMERKGSLEVSVGTFPGSPTT